MPLVTAHGMPAQTVLVVEDQAFLRYMTMDEIAGAGFEVVGASSSDEAMTILAERPDIGLVFSDVDLPGSIDGAAMALGLDAMHRPCGVILTSGRPAESIGRIPSHGIFLPKPYVSEDLVRVLHSMAQDVPCAA